MPTVYVSAPSLIVLGPLPSLSTIRPPNLTGDEMGEPHDSSVSNC